MILGIIGLGIFVGITAGSSALFAGYSILTILWLYSLAGCLTVLTGIFLLSHTAKPHKVASISPKQPPSFR